MDITPEIQQLLDTAREEGRAEGRKEESQARAELEQAVIYLAEQHGLVLMRERCDLLARFNTCSAQAHALWLA